MARTWPIHAQQALARRQPPARPTCAAARRAICRFLASGPPAGQAKKSRVTSRARAPQVYLDVARCPWRACDARGERARLEPANGLACAALSSGSRSCSSQPRSFCRSQSRIIHSRSHSRNSHPVVKRSTFVAASFAGPLAQSVLDPTIIPCPMSRWLVPVHVLNPLDLL